MAPLHNYQQVAGRIKRMFLRKILQKIIHEDWNDQKMW